jgi:hypothetical protein
MTAELVQCPIQHSTVQYLYIYGLRFSFYTPVGTNFICMGNNQHQILEEALTRPSPWPSPCPKISDRDCMSQGSGAHGVIDPALTERGIKRIFTHYGLNESCNNIIFLSF